MYYGSGTYGGSEYGGLIGSLVLSGVCATESSGESCIAYGAVPVLETGGAVQHPIFGQHPPIRRIKKLKGKVFTESYGGETFARAETSLSGIAKTKTSKSKSVIEAGLIFDSESVTTSKIGNRKASGELIFNCECKTTQVENEIQVLASQQFEARSKSKSSKLSVGAAGALVFIGVGTGASPDLESEAVGNVAIPVIGSGATSYPSGETIAKGKIQYAYRAKGISKQAIEESYGHGFAEDINARDEEELISILSVLS